jgi:RNA recognition motif-containing protein
LESVRNALKMTNSKLNGKKVRVDFNVEGSKKIVKNLKKTQKIENMIHVSNLKFETTRFEIEDLFNTIGKVVSINMPANKNGRV